MTRVALALVLLALPAHAGDTAAGHDLGAAAVALYAGFFGGLVIGIAAAELADWRGPILILAAVAAVIWMMGAIATPAHAGDTAGPALTELAQRSFVDELPPCTETGDCCSTTNPCCPGCDDSPYPVPLPAPGLLLAAGIGGLLAMKARRA